MGLKKHRLWFFTFFMFFMLSAGILLSHAQAQQTIQTEVGIAGNNSTDVSNQDLGPGEFTTPFKCGLSYRGVNYVGHSHWAVDFNRGASGHIGGDYGDPVYAGADGEVISEIPINGQIAILHRGGFVTVYAHFSKRLVHFGDKVKLGDKIGEIGNTYFKPGQSIDAHLHYQQCSSRNSCWYPDTNTVQIKFKGEKYPFSCYSCDKDSNFNISCDWPN